MQSATRLSLTTPLKIMLAICCTVFTLAIHKNALCSDVDYYKAEAQAIAVAVSKVGDAVVQIEVVGVAETPGGEVAADAPTSGTVVDPKGFILATSQVTARPSASILVVLQDGTRLPAEVVAEDKGRELVMLKVETDKPLPAIDVIPAEGVRVGQYAIAVGRILPDTPPAKSVGIVSALSRLDGRAMQTDARISPPFYGGPLINIRGQLLGIIVPAMPDMGGTGDKSGWYDSGIAFVAPAAQIESRLEKLKAGQSIQPGKLGIVAGSQDPLADGTSISAVRVGSPAAEVEMQPGDVIQKINGKSVLRHADIKQVLGSLDAGTEVTVQLLRDGQSLEVKPTLVAEIPPFEPQTLGVLVDDLDADLKVTAVFPDSAAERAGIQRNDQITKIGDKQVKDLSDLRNRVLTLLGGREVAVQVQRQNKPLTLNATPESIANLWPFELPPLPVIDSEAEANLDGDGNAAKRIDDSANWTVTELSLPDVPNKAAMVSPPETAAKMPHGVLVRFTAPGEEDVAGLAEKWKSLAAKFRVIVVIISSANAERWNPDEAVLAARFVSVVRKRFTIQPFAIAITGDGAGASLAMIAAFTDAATFSGVAVPGDLKPPAIQLRENDPTKPLHLMVQSEEDLPTWGEVLRKAGYAVIKADADDEGVFRFTWGMGRI